MSDLPIAAMRAYGGLWYVATPYTRHPGGLDAAANEAARAAAVFVDAGINVYCPIAMTHVIAKHTTVSATDHERWMRLDLAFLPACAGLCVVAMKGWEESRGVQEEVAAFKAAGKPVVVMPWELGPALGDQVGTKLGPSRTAERRLLVIGDGNAGKDEFATLLYLSTGLTNRSSSEAAAPYVFRQHFRNFYRHWLACWEDRRNHRDSWKAAISDYNRDDPARLAREVLEHANVYVGMRSRREFDAARELFDTTVWIDRDVPRDPSNELTRDDADVIVENSGTLDDLRRKVERIANLL